MNFFLYAPTSFEPWDWRNSVEGGIGGSETSQVFMSKGLAEQGHSVISYSPVPNDCPGEWCGVKWIHFSKADFSQPGVWVIYRSPETFDHFDVSRSDQVLWLLAQDWDYPGLSAERAAKMDRFIVLCRSHERYIHGRRPELIGKTWVTRNGIRNDLIAEVEKDTPPRNPHRMMYASSPDRGLKSSLLVYRRAKEFIPDLELHATYGFGNIDVLIAKGATHFAKDKEECLRLVEETGATFHGRLTQNQLYREWLKTSMLIYITSFFETGWITGLEGQALGAIPIYSPVYAQGENTRHGIQVHGFPHDESTIAEAAAQVVRLCRNPELQEKIRVPMMADVRANWDWSQFVWKKKNENWIDAAEEDFAKKANRVTNSGSPRLSAGLCDNDDEVASRDMWLKLNEGDVFVDVGAADGSWTIAAAKQGAKVLAVECAAAFTKLDEQVEAAGVADQVSVFPVFAGRSNGGKVEIGTRNKDVDIPTMTVDSIVVASGVDRVDFVKIDVEGEEVDVVKGMIGVLSRFRPRLMIEVHTEVLRGKKVKVEDVKEAIAESEVGYQFVEKLLAYQGRSYVHLYAMPVVPWERK